VRPDRFTRGLEATRPGDVVTLVVTETGEPIASALADPGAEIAARVFHARPGMAFTPEAAIDRALARRERLLAEPGTDCLRLVHGEGDHLPGLRVERYADVLVILVLAACAAPWVDRVARRLLERLPGSTVVIRDHKDDLRREDVHSRRFGGGVLDPDAAVVGSELGARYPLRPFAGLATGLYVDQRETRRWLAASAEGLRICNLFAYTGAFAVKLLMAGAASAVDVDLAGPALKRAEEAAEMNGVSARHRTVKSDCRTFLLNTDDTFDLVIVDPPTAAMGGDGWVLRRDYPEVLALSLRRLAPGGLLVACCNTLGGKPYPLREAVQDAARGAGVSIRPVDGPPLGADIPQLKGFPEGRPYRLVAVRRSQ
jgi:23S rRNA (cytosine1962-C5)-methyltransferase